MKHFLKDLLADPITGENLIEEKRGEKYFLSSGEHSYLINEEVPILLPDNEIKNSNSELHTSLNSDFNYTAHYQEDAQYFDYFIEAESAATKEEIRRLHQVIAKHIPEKAKLILDAGCGNGWAAHFFLTKEKKVVSMDISLKNPTKVLKEYPHENHAAIAGDVYHLPFKKNSFDAIIASEIMEHVYDPKLFISKLLEVLKPGGKLIITTPYNEKIEYFLCVHCNKPTPQNAHLHSFNEKNITAFIPEELADFKTEKFSNKYLVRLRLNLLMSFLPFHLWKFKDSVVNSIFKKPLRFLIELNKK
ncbi:MAG: methyltransferase domain-containing protein [Bacteroidota bacterium]|nr:methyltransferase domain-containing protein [Bacteroidota bacterium]